jgi:hypothetical protein
MGSSYRITAVIRTFDSASASFGERSRQSGRVKLIDSAGWTRQPTPVASCLLQRVAGHQDPVVTSRYLHPDHQAVLDVGLAHSR